MPGTAADGGTIEAANPSQLVIATASAASWLYCCTRHGPLDSIAVDALAALTHELCEAGTTVLPAHLNVHDYWDAQFIREAAMPWNRAVAATAVGSVAGLAALAGRYAAGVAQADRSWPVQVEAGLGGFGEVDEESTPGQRQSWS